MTTELIPLRAASYNDIKKRRMLRQSRTKSKLKNTQTTAEIVRTEKKVYPCPQIDQYADERPNEIELARQNGGHCRQQPRKVGQADTVKRNLENSDSSRIDTSKNQKAPREREEAIASANSRQIVRGLIQESKSQRKLVRYNELRNKFKLSKSRSKTKSTHSLVQKSRILAKRLIDIQATPVKPEHAGLNGIKNSHRVKRFDSVQEPGCTRRNRYLVNAPNQQQQLFKGKKKQQPIKMEDQVESSIELQKQSSMFDSQDDKFLQQICLQHQNSHKIIAKQSHPNADSKILDLLDVENRQLSRAIERKQRQKKILKDLQKLNRKFPKGFFKI